MAGDGATAPGAAPRQADKIRSQTAGHAQPTVDGRTSHPFVINDWTSKYSELGRGTLKFFPWRAPKRTRRVKKWQDLADIVNLRTVLNWP